MITTITIKLNFLEVAVLQNLNREPQGMNRVSVQDFKILEAFTDYGIADTWRGTFFITLIGKRVLKSNLPFRYIY